VNHGVIDVFAYQEALLIEAVFGVALLTMLWVGFRRWLQHKERIERLIADQIAERAAQYNALTEHVEARLKAVEEKVGDGGSEVPARIEAPATDPTDLA